MKKLLFLCLFSLIVIFALVLYSCDTSDKELNDFVVSPGINVNFGTIHVLDYTLQPRTVRVTNETNSAVTAAVALTGKNASSFSLSDSSISLEADSTSTFTVSVKPGLSWGNHQAMLTISANNFETYNVNVRINISNAEEKHLFLSFGQSNMQGPGTIRTQDSANISERWQTLNVVQGVYATVNRAKSQWYRGVPPLITPDANLPHWQASSHRAGLGPSDYFGRTLVDNLPENISLGIVAVANGDLALASFHKTQAANYFAPNSGGEGRETNRPSSTERQGWDRYRGANYESLYDAIITNAKLAQSQGWIVKGIIVHQGESGRGLTYTSWHAMLKEIYDDMLSDLGLQPNSIPILLGQLWNGGTGSFNMITTDNKIQTAENPNSIPPNSFPNAWVISSAGCNIGRDPDRIYPSNSDPNSFPLFNENLHFGPEDLQLLGTRYGAKMLELVYNKVITVD